MDAARNEPMTEYKSRKKRAIQARAVKKLYRAIGQEKTARVTRRGL